MVTEEIKKAVLEVLENAPKNILGGVTNKWIKERLVQYPKLFVGRAIQDCIKDGLVVEIKKQYLILKKYHKHKLYDC